MDDSDENGDVIDEDYVEECEEDYSDPEDFVDDITDEELLGDLLRKRPKETDGVESCIVVDNIPQVGQDRLEKLQMVLRKIFSKFGKIVNEFYPKENGKTMGYVFFEYGNPNSAREAVKMTKGYKLDKLHTFEVNLLTDFDKYSNIPEDWEPPEPQLYKDPGNLRHWLMDNDCHDQYSVIHDGGDRTCIFLNTPLEPRMLEERAKWTETYVRWSPLGTYLATFHQRGIALWGGENFRQIMKFSHSGVHLIDFSPCEKYLVTFSPLPDNKDDPQAIIIWDLRTGIKKRGFHCEKDSVWPIFKWSHDGKYLARMSPDTLSVYETPSFALLDKKSLKVTNLKDFSWSPSDNIIVYWVPEDNNVPARVVLLEMPSRKELRVKNLFSVADIKMFWQKTGDYLSVKVDRYAKSRKDDKGEVKFAGMYYNFEIFHIREKQIPVDVVELKEPIIAFAWEPVGSKFAVIHGESTRITVSFYTVKSDNQVSLFKSLEKRQANHLFWSPQGQFCVLAGLRGLGGVLEFVDTNDVTVMNGVQHDLATDVEWDPTGRYVISAVSWWTCREDTGYWLWSFQGKLMQRHAIDRFCQVLWRPRPPTLLTKDHMKEIKKNLKKYAAGFDLKDKMTQSKASKELIEKRQELMKEFNDYRKKCHDIYESLADQREELRKGQVDEQESEDLEEETIEFFIKEEEIIIDSE
ncbi:PREDICTED: eukaryotic translation initiation factor 3 subunit B-like [Priapulus caudatus]|uniref:Eukaryotic translation initiation factor 3 subunit B n=1 Tax=Priapulus caudatus TaxID=37621 RepID=A0ABM1F956_PRICU|nr:PREDICTED: eukaryotic translation initiation factor 3 subunit B-like [Priapulus caudatus]